MDSQLDSQKIQILLKLKPIRVFLVFVLSILFFPQLVIMGFNAGFGKNLFAEISGNTYALCLLLGSLLAYSVTLFYSRAHLRLTLDNLFIDLRFSHVLYAVFIGLLFTAVITALMLIVPAPAEFQKETVELLNGSLLTQIILIAFTTVLGPIIEEYVFRDYIFDGLQQKFSFPVTALFTSMLFTLPHMLEYYVYWPAALVIFSLGMLLAYCRIKHTSLLPCIILHASYNSGLLLLFYAADFI